MQLNVCVCFREYIKSHRTLTSRRHTQTYVYKCTHIYSQCVVFAPVMRRMHCVRVKEKAPVHHVPLMSDGIGKRRFVNRERKQLSATSSCLCQSLHFSDGVDLWGGGGARSEFRPKPQTERPTETVHKSLPFTDHHMGRCNSGTLKN